MKAASERNPAGDQATGDKKARPGHQERRQGFDRDFDAEIRGAPDEIDSRKTGDERGFGRNFIRGSHDFKMLKKLAHRLGEREGMATGWRPLCD